MIPTFHSSVKRGRIFPLLVTCSGETQDSSAFRILSEDDSPLKHPVAMRQLTVVDSQACWSLEEARQLLVNETSLALRKVIVNRHNQHNPMRQWNDATWFYTWEHDQNGGSHCVIIPIIAITVKDIPLQRPERHKWFHLAPALKSHIMNAAAKGSLQTFPGSLMGHLKALIGDHLMEEDLSLPRPDLKKMKQGVEFPDTDHHPLGCGENSEEEKLVQDKLDRIPSFPAE
ncbi:hypothetical protein KC19_1G087600 [Ceratodon purpureus]|uniref:Uncharacterized protein n=1 Tax=Ceratodon purpureus TaxID=3225 RepID=A0A8T0J5W0_CERPU|nr:hypothetical protein KC19_1G087600 [Ceratodon purpureus]